MQGSFVLKHNIRCCASELAAHAAVKEYWALLKEYRALLKEYWALLKECGARDVVLQN